VKNIYVFMFILALLVGCTAPTQPWAEKNIKMGQAQYAGVVNDLANIAYQRTLDEADRLVREKEDPAARSAAVVKMSDEYHKISYEEIEAAKAAELLRNSYEWIHAQRGILNILFEDIGKAIKQSDENDKIPVSQPAETIDGT